MHSGKSVLCLPVLCLQGAGQHLLLGEAGGAQHLLPHAHGARLAVAVLQWATSSATLIAIEVLVPTAQVVIV